MPWPMVHFAVAAETMSEPSPEFLLGSLAPDSVHVRTNDRIEKAKTHLMIVAGEFLTDEQLYGVFEANRRQAEADPRFLHYLLGYLAHIYTDRKWTFEVYPAYEAHPEGRSQYHRDVQAIEFMLLREKADGRAWLEQLKSGTAFELGGLSAEEVYAYRQLKLDMLAAPPSELESLPSLLSSDELDDFIRRTGLDLRQLFTEWTSSQAAAKGERKNPC